MSEERRGFGDQFRDQAGQEEPERTAPPSQVIDRSRERWPDPPPRKTVTWKIDERISELVREIAEARGLSPASAASGLLLEGLECYAEGQAVFEGRVYPSQASRWRWTVIASSGFLERISRAIRERIEGGSE